MVVEKSVVKILIVFGIGLPLASKTQLGLIQTSFATRLRIIITAIVAAIV